MNAARRVRGVAAYTTLAPPQHTVVPRGGGACEALSDVEYLVFTELVWAGKATMQGCSMRHTCSSAREPSSAPPGELVATTRGLVIKDSVFDIRCAFEHGRGT